MLACAVLVLAVSAAPYAQRPAVPVVPDDGRRSASQEEERIREKMLQDAAKRRNKERQEALKKDTDKLMALCTELKEQVDKSNENILSLDVIKKAEEIEKLAKSVREKMKADNY